MAAVMDTKAAEALTYRARQFEKPLPDAGADKEAFSADTRLPYQRDLGRIVHSASFRRLQTKTQVMGTGEGDFHRTRLTHSLEVGHIGRGIVWNLAARDGGEYHDLLPPSELIEAICYAHDLGHPPYGHSGERALHSRMKAFGGFEGNAQTIRILAKLEKYYRGEGIKPTRRLFLGVLKYPVAYSEYGATKAQGEKSPKCFYDDDKELIERSLSIFPPHDVREFRTLSPAGKPKYKDFDCSIMELADDIAYGVHDLEDGIARGILKRSEIEASIRDGFKTAGVQKIREVSIDGEAYPVVPGSPICGMRMPSAAGGRGHSVPRAIGVSTVPLGQNAEETATGMRISSSRHLKTWKPTPFQISPATPVC